MTKKIATNHCSPTIYDDLSAEREGFEPILLLLIKLNHITLIINTI